jgi:N-acyl-D-amino-acid deacylase
MFDWVITGGKMVDGSGAAWRYADLGISGGKITAIGHLEGASACQTIDARGKIVCPGFIDTHSHCDLTLMAGHWVEERLRQGITTEVVGQDGLSYSPASGPHLDEWRRYLVGLNGNFPEITWDWQTAGQLLEHYKNKAANVVYLSPHGALRTEVMGWADRPATTSELHQMQDLVRRELDEGAAGISTGLTYIPCNHATTEEMIALCQPVGKAGGILSIHLRSYAGKLHEAIDEAVEIGRQTGAAIQISHLRVADPSLWGTAHAILERLQRARASGVDVTFDIYPYTVGCAPLFCLLPAWAQAGGPDAILQRLQDTQTRAMIATDMTNLNLDWSLYTLSNACIPGGKNWEGFTLTHAAQTLNHSVFDFMMDLLSQTGLDATIVAAGGSEADNVEMFRSPFSMVCSDGVMVGGQPHPRGYGAFPRVIAEYVRRRPVLRLEEAIHKMSGVSANRMNLTDRGALRVGAAADVVVFSLDEIADGANFREGRLPTRGIDWVMVNGEAAIANGIYTGMGAGQPQTPLIIK